MYHQYCIYIYKDKIPEIAICTWINIHELLSLLNAIHSLSSGVNIYIYWYPYTGEINGFSPVWTHMYHSEFMNQTCYHHKLMRLMVSHPYEVTYIIIQRSCLRNVSVTDWFLSSMNTHESFRDSASEILLSQTDKRNSCSPVWTQYHSGVLAHTF